MDAGGGLEAGVWEMAAGWGLEVWSTEVSRLEADCIGGYRVVAGGWRLGFSLSLSLGLSLWGDWRWEVGVRRLGVGSLRLEVGGCRVEVGGWRVEGGGWRLDAGGWTLGAKWKVGGWRLEVGGWRLDSRLEVWFEFEFEIGFAFEFQLVESEAGGWGLEVEGWRLEAGCWGLEVGGLEHGGWSFEGLLTNGIMARGSGLETDSLDGVRIPIASYLESIPTAN